MELPLLISLPHAGLCVPPEVEQYCILSPLQVAEDGDVGAVEIYDLLNEVRDLVSSDVARAIVDLNRAEDDRRKDGVVKTHTCWDVPIYEPSPPKSVFETLLELYYRPYHERLSRLGGSGKFPLAVDCHTTAGHGPPVGPDPGAERPWVCLSNADGTCPQAWIELLGQCFRNVFDGPVTINEPFQGGYITRTHAAEMPWVQLELSRAPFLTNSEKRQGVIEALRAFCRGAL